MAITRVLGATGVAATIPALVGGTGRTAVTGNILQVVHATTTTQVSISSTTLTDTTLTAAITPASTSNKVLILATHNGNFVSSANVNNALRIILLRTTTAIGRTGGVNWIDSSVDSIASSASFNVLDSPSTTSATTYKTQFTNINNSAAAAVQYTFGSDWDTTSYITLMEIAG